MRHALVRNATASALLAIALIAALAQSSASAASRGSTQTLVFDALATGSFVDKPPAGPSPGDTELSTSKLLDARGHVVGTDKTTCVFTRQIPDDMLERCASTVRTAEGT